MKEPMFAETEQLKLFEMTSLLDPKTGETVCYLIFPCTSEELLRHAATSSQDGPLDQGSASESDLG
jgi:hypothetical protein